MRYRSCSEGPNTAGLIGSGLRRKYTQRTPQVGHEEDSDSSCNHSCSSSSLSEVERRARARERLQASKAKEKKEEENCCMIAITQCCTASCGWLYEASSVCVGASAWRKQWAEYEERLL